MAESVVAELAELAVENCASYATVEVVAGDAHDTEERSTPGCELALAGTDAWIPVDQLPPDSSPLVPRLSPGRPRAARQCVR